MLPWWMWALLLSLPCVGIVEILVGVRKKKQGTPGPFVTMIFASGAIALAIGGLLIWAVLSRVS